MRTLAWTRACGRGRERAGAHGLVTSDDGRLASKFVTGSFVRRSTGIPASQDRWGRIKSVCYLCLLGGRRSVTGASPAGCSPCGDRLWRRPAFAARSSITGHTTTSSLRRAHRCARTWARWACRTGRRRCWRLVCGRCWGRGFGWPTWSWTWTRTFA